MSDLPANFQEKIRARLRGAGTRQSAFRNFTIGKSQGSAAEQPPPPPASVSTATDTANTSSTFSTPFLSKPSHAEDVNSETLQRQRLSSTTNGTHTGSTALQPTNGLDEKHQERLQSRLRGAGTHRSTFRGFKITLSEKNASATEDSDQLDAGSVAGSERRRSPRKHQHLTTNTSIPASTTLITAVRNSSTAAAAAAHNRELSGTTPMSQAQWGGKGKAFSSGQRPVPADAKSSARTVGAAQKRGMRDEEEEEEEEGRDGHRVGQLAETQVENAMSIEQDFDDLDPPTHDFDPWQPDAVDSDIADFDSATQQPPIRKRGVSRPLPTTPTKKRRLDQAQLVPTSPSANRSRRDVQARRTFTAADENAETSEHSTLLKARDQQQQQQASIRKTGTIAASKARASAAESAVPSSPVTRSMTKSTLVQTRLSVAAQPLMSESRTRTATLQYTVPNIDDDDDIFALPKRVNKGKRVVSRSSNKRSGNKKTSTRSKDKSKTKGKGKGKQRDDDSSDDDDDSDGEYGQPVKMYRQLQIQCLKFFGPSTTASRPAKLSNLDKAKQASVEGEERPVDQDDSYAQPTLTQSVLQFETAPLSEMDVIAEAVRAVADQFIDSIQDEATARELGVFRANLETLLIEQVDLQDDHALLRSSVKKASRLKKELRARLLAAQRQHQAAKEQLERVRADFERQERVRRRVEETHLFLNNLETMCSGVQQIEIADNAETTHSTPTVVSGDGDEVLKLQSLVATVAARSGGGGAEGDSNNQGSSVVSKLRDFNRILENVDQAVRGYKLDEDSDS